MWEYNYTDELAHHGIKGMKWGVRRFQTSSGKLTAAGKKRYNKWEDSKHQPSSVRSSILAGTYAATGSARVAKALDKSNAKDAERWEKAKAEKRNRELNAKSNAAQENETEKKGLSDKQKTALKVGAAAAGTIVAAYGAYKVSDVVLPD